MEGIDLRDRSVIELGAGTGLLGIVVTLLGKGCFVASFKAIHSCSKTAFLHEYAWYGREHRSCMCGL